jgi:hypothetical protein
VEKTAPWLFVIALWTQAGLSGEAARPVPVPTPAQYRWNEQERIMFVHLSPATWQGVEHDNLSTPLDRIMLPNLDIDQWCQAAVAWSVGRRSAAGQRGLPRRRRLRVGRRED